jgi:hypothetical protein
MLINIYMNDCSVSTWRPNNIFPSFVNLNIFVQGLLVDTKPYAAKFYKSTAWRKCRYAYFAYRHRLCERCQGAGKIVPHKQYITPANINDPDITTLNFSNLELLCKDCHNREHHEVYSPVVEGLMFDSNGDLVRRESG